MADLPEKQTTAPQVTHPADTDSDQHEQIARPHGWIYRERRLFGYRIPCYASPQIQLLMVSFVCFLCPGTNLGTMSPNKSLTQSRHVQRRERSGRRWSALKNRRQ